MRAVAVALVAFIFFGILTVLAAQWAGDGQEAYALLEDGVRDALADLAVSVSAAVEVRVRGVSERVFSLSVSWPSEGGRDAASHCGVASENGGDGAFRRLFDRDLLAASASLARPLLSAAFGLYKSRFVAGASSRADGGGRLASVVSLELHGDRIPLFWAVGVPAIAGATAAESASASAFDAGPGAGSAGQSPGFEAGGAGLVPGSETGSAGQSPGSETGSAGLVPDGRTIDGGGFGAIGLMREAGGAKLREPVKLDMRFLEVNASILEGDRVEGVRMAGGYELEGADGDRVAVDLLASLSFGYGS